MAMTTDQHKGTWKDRLGYFWMYYKVPVILIAIGVVMAISFVHAAVTEKPSALSVMMLDVHTDAADDELSTDFMNYAGIDSGKNSVTISTTQMLTDAGSASYQMGSLAKLYTSIGTGDLDVCSMLEDGFGKYADADSFMDLRDVFTEDELNTFPALYTSEDGKVLGIYCGQMPKMQEISGYANGTGVIGIMYNTEHTDMAAEYLRYLNDNS